MAIRTFTGVLSGVDNTGSWTDCFPNDINGSTTYTETADGSNVFLADGVSPQVRVTWTGSNWVIDVYCGSSFAATTSLGTNVSNGPTNGTYSLNWDGSGQIVISGSGGGGGGGTRYQPSWSYNGNRVIGGGFA